MPAPTTTYEACFGTDIYCLLANASYLATLSANQTAARRELRFVARSQRPARSSPGRFRDASSRSIGCVAGAPAHGMHTRRVSTADHEQSRAREVAVPGGEALRLTTNDGDRDGERPPVTAERDTESARCESASPTACAMRSARIRLRRGGRPCARDLRTGGVARVRAKSDCLTTTIARNAIAAASTGASARCA